MAFHRLSLLLLLACSLLFLTGETRPSPASIRPSLAVSRLQSGGMIQCWDSLLELKACTSEVILFFLNGETNLGPSCCNAIRIIEHRCWPSMLTTLGFTPEEGDVLTGYCDASDARRRRATPPPSPTSLGPTSPFQYSAQGGLVSEDLVVH
ncbi:hypothetical protein Taro_017729 [Colocasia esculenta]|uniref:Prolamin-like domain-containing protein n=1 Tax=Colocasia esculenta TaxID=4460 RepID=A0A843URX0_COLES|nr:hypothetical protein [Colocasia esculenta]